MTSPAQFHYQPGVPEPIGDDGERLESLLRIPLTWRIIAWWTVGYGIVSWLVEWVASGFDHTVARTPFWFGMNRMVYAVVWSGAIIIAIVLTEWKPVSRFSRPGRIALHVVACIVMTVVWAVVAYYACLAIVPGWKPLGIGRMLSTTAKSVLFGYVLVTIIVHIVCRMRLYRAQEVTMLRQARRATEAQLHILKMELQPHFLFNALNSISSLIHRDPNAADETLHRLSDMLRHSMETSRVHEVPLRKELETLRLYAQIERVRLGERLDITWHIDEDTLDAEVPHMVLQPLLENAIKHGLEGRPASGRIDIAAERDGEWLKLRVRDDGPGPDARAGRAGNGLGIGIGNVCARLEELHGTRHTFMLSGAPGGGSEVTITLPFVS